MTVKGQLSASRNIRALETLTGDLIIDDTRCHHLRFDPFAQVPESLEKLIADGRIHGRIEEMVNRAQGSRYHIKEMGEQATFDTVFMAFPLSKTQAGLTRTVTDKMSSSIPWKSATLQA